MTGQPPVRGGLQQEAVGAVQGQGGNGARRHQRQLRLQEADPGILARANREEQDTGGDRDGEPVAATGTSTRMRGARGRSGQRPSRRRFSGTMAPISSAMPRM